MSKRILAVPCKMALQIDFLGKNLCRMYKLNDSVAGTLPALCALLNATLMYSAQSESLFNPQERGGNPLAIRACRPNRYWRMLERGMGILAGLMATASGKIALPTFTAPPPFKWGFTFLRLLWKELFPLGKIYLPV